MWYLNGIALASSTGDGCCGPVVSGGDVLIAIGGSSQKVKFTSRKCIELENCVLLTTKTSSNS